MCTFENPQQPKRTVSVMSIPGASTNDLGDYIYPAGVANNPLCGFAQFPPKDNFDWTRLKGKTPSVSTGPTGDKTTGQGKLTLIFIIIKKVKKMRNIS